MLLGNEEIREFNEYLFNDTFLAMYILACIYLITKNQPFLASLFLTLSLSIKAGSMLLLPTFMGWLQYQYGSVTLIISLLIIVLFQFVIMTPLSFDPISNMFGFLNGGTHWYDYLKYAKFLGGDQERQYGSTYDNTIYWQIVGRTMYYEQWFVDGLKKCMLLVNIYYFFIR